MKLLITILLYCCSLIIALPIKSTAAFYVPHKAVVLCTPTAGLTPRSPHTRTHHFNGSRHRDFCGTFALICSALGSFALAAALCSVVLAAPAVAFVAATYGFSILGIVFGFISNSDARGGTAVVLGFCNLLLLLLAGAIYSAVMGDFVPLLKFFLKFLLLFSLAAVCHKKTS